MKLQAIWKNMRPALLCSMVMASGSLYSAETPTISGQRPDTGSSSVSPDIQRRIDAIRLATASLNAANKSQQSKQGSNIRKKASEAPSLTLRTLTPPPPPPAPSTARASLTTSTNTDDLLVFDTPSESASHPTPQSNIGSKDVPSLSALLQSVGEKEDSIRAANKAELQNLRDDLIKTKRSVSDLKEANQKLSEDNAKLTTKLSNVKESSRSLIASAKLLQAQYDDATTRIKELESKEQNTSALLRTVAEALQTVIQSIDGSIDSDVQLALNQLLDRLNDTLK